MGMMRWGFLIFWIFLTVGYFVMAGQEKDVGRTVGEMVGGVACIVFIIHHVLMLIAERAHP